MTLRVTALASGSSGNALLVRTPQTALLIDCGLPLRTLEPLLCAAGTPPDALCAVLLTHEHGDHTQGAGVLARRDNIPLLCNSETAAALGEMGGKTSRRHLHNVALEALPVGQAACLGGIEVCSFAVPHDAANPVGYLLRAEGATVAIAVDLGSWDAALVETLQPANLLIIEANHSREHLLRSAYPWAVCQRIIGPRGHLDNQQTGALLASIAADQRPRDVYLAHLSQHANTAARALKSVQSVLRHANITHLRIKALPRQATPTRKGLPTWSSDRLFRQMALF